MKPAEPVTSTSIGIRLPFHSNWGRLRWVQKYFDRARPLTIGGSRECLAILSKGEDVRHQALHRRPGLQKHVMSDLERVCPLAVPALDAVAEKSLHEAK